MRRGPIWIGEGMGHSPRPHGLHRNAARCPAALLGHASCVSPAPGRRASPQVTVDYTVICAGIYSQPYIPDYEVSAEVCGRAEFEAGTARSGSRAA